MNRLRMLGETTPNTLPESLKKQDRRLPMQRLVVPSSLRPSENCGTKNKTEWRTEKWSASASKVQQQCVSSTTEAARTGCDHSGTTAKEQHTTLRKKTYPPRQEPEVFDTMSASLKVLKEISVKNQVHRAREGRLSSALHFPAGVHQSNLQGTRMDGIQEHDSFRQLLYPNLSFSTRRGGDLTTEQSFISRMLIQQQERCDNAAELERLLLLSAKHRKVLTSAQGAALNETLLQTRGIVGTMGESAGITRLPREGFSSASWYTLGSCAGLFAPSNEETLLSLLQRKAYATTILQQELHRSMVAGSSYNWGPSLRIDRRAGHHSDSVDLVSRSRKSTESQDFIRSMAMLIREDTIYDPFPVKLHRLLRDLETSRVTADGDMIASFLPDGSAFAVFDVARFESCVMKLYFPRMNQFASFQRQLNLYDFQRIPYLTGKGGGSAYFHPEFQRDFPILCLEMKRTKIKGSKLGTGRNGL